MQLSFEYFFKHPDDEVKCAYTVPYTYTDLQVHLKQLKLLAHNQSKLNVVNRCRYEFH